MHTPIYGIFAALGLMAALALSQRTARYTGLPPEAVWSAGMTAILSAFLISRLLLVAFNLRSFLQYPLLVLALPSLTTTGMVLTALFMLGYMRWHKLPLLPMLDAFAPCASLLWAFLSLGRFAGGTRGGMPLHVPRGAAGTWDKSVHPIELYALITASLICLAILQILRTSRCRGQTTAIALVSSGFAIFFIDFFRLPSDLLPNLWLDPSQIVGIAMVLAGVSLSLYAVRPAAAPQPTAIGEESS